MSKKKFKYGRYELEIMAKYGSCQERVFAKKRLADLKNKKTSKPAKEGKSNKPRRRKIKLTPTPIGSEAYKWIKSTQLQLLKNETDAEKEFYSVLETLDIPYKKQYYFHINGRIFFADAVFLETKTVIEVDGAYHRRKDVRASDAERTRLLNGIGYKVVRITNEEVYDIPLFMSKIEKHLPIKVDTYMYV